MKTVLVTGAAGFLGAHLCRNLISKYRVVGLDNLSFGNLKNIADLEGNENFHFFKADASNAEEVKRVVGDVRIDHVVHMAAYKIPKYRGRLDVLLNNVETTKRMLELCAEHGAKMTFASTSEVFGLNGELPFKEDSRLVMGETKIRKWAYAVSKIYDEHLCFAYAEERGVPATIIRYFGSYGPGQHMSWRSGPIGIFIDAVLKNQKITIHGDGSQKRTFLYVDDAIDATIRTMESQKANGEVFNISSTEEISILDLARLIKRLSVTEGELQLEMVEHEKLFGKYDEVYRRVADISKAERLLQWKPTVSLEEGLKKTIEWQRNQ